MSLHARLRRALLAGVPLGALVALAFLTLPASAHEQVAVAPYNFTVGWREEPAVVGSLNGLDLGVEVNGSGTPAPVTGAQGSLTATISSGGTSAQKALSPEEGRPGWYTFDMIPSRQGAFAVRIVGDLNGTAVNFSVNLDPPAARADLEFPLSDPTASDLSSRIASNATALNALTAAQAALAARVATLEAGPVGGDAAAAASAAATAMLLGLAGVAAGLAGAAMGALAWRKGKSKA